MGSTGAVHREVLDDDRDSFVNMMLRREINETLVEQKVDFNAASLKLGQVVLGDELTCEDAFLDIGCSNGSIISKAATKTNFRGRLIGIEPLFEAIYSSSATSNLHKQITILNARGEQLPLADNTVKGATLHNVIFRTDDADAMLREVQRVVVPGGPIAISSNDKEHATKRHKFENEVSIAFRHETGQQTKILLPPAEGRYLSDLRSLIGSIGGLSILDELYLAQDTVARITPGVPLELYLTSIQYSAVDAHVPKEHRRTWRHLVEEIVRPQIKQAMATSPNGYTFTDPVKRGMFMIRNDKAA